MQRNWIGRSDGRDRSRFPVEGHDDVEIEVFTTRPDTLFGATYMVLAPEHPLVDDDRRRPSGPTTLSPTRQQRRPDGVEGHLRHRRRSRPRRCAATASSPAQKSELERQAEGKEKTGVFTGAFAINPVERRAHPDLHRRLRADGLRHRRDHGRARARRARLRVRARVRPADRAGDPADRRVARRARRRPPTTRSTWPEAYVGDGVAHELGERRGVARRPARRRREARDHRVARARRARASRRSPTSCATGCSAGSATGASRSRSSTTSDGSPVAVPESMLPVELPEITDFEPEIVATTPTACPSRRSRARRAGSRSSSTSGPTGRRRRHVPAARRTRCRSGPARAGTTCATSTPPTRTRSSTPRSSGTGWARSSTATRGGVDLYVGGVEHAVLHLLYARFWHKVLFDLGHVSTPEPFQRLVQPGLHPGARVHRRARRRTSRPTEVDERDGAFFLDGEPVHARVREDGQEPEERRSRPTTSTATTAPTRCGSTRCSWARSTRAGRGTPPTSSACTASCSGCGATSSTRTPASRASPTTPADDETRRLLHRTIAAVRDDMDDAELQHRDRPAVRAEQPPHRRSSPSGGAAPREVVEPLVLMLAPLAPHVAEELWARLGHADIARLRGRSRPPTRRCSSTTTVEIPVQVNGKVRGARHGAGRRRRRRARSRGPRRRRASPSCSTARRCARSIVVPGRLVNFVVA